MGELKRIFENKETGELSSRKIGEKWMPINLVFDKDTKIVYYKFTEYAVVNSKMYPQSDTDTKVSYMTPYLGRNGHSCCFLEEEEKGIVELF